MRVQAVSVCLTQQDIEEALNDWMPEGYTMERVHVHHAGVMASLKTPHVRFEVLLRQEQDLSAGVFVFTLEVSKVVLIPRKLVQYALEKIAGSLPTGVTIAKNSVVIDMNQLWAPFAHAESVTCTFKDGEAHLSAKLLSVHLREATDIARDGIA